MEYDLMMHEEPESDSSLGRGIVSQLWRRKVLILACFAVGLCGGYLELRRQPHEFISTAEVVVIKQSPGLTDANLADVDDYVKAQAKLIVSPLIVSRALADPRFHSDLVARDYTANRMMNALSAKFDGNLLTLQFQESDPDACRIVLDAVIGSYENFLNETLVTNSEETFKQITEKAEILRERIRAEENHLQSLQKRWNVEHDEPNPEVASSRRAAVDAKRFDIMIRREELESQLRRLQQRLNELEPPEPQVAERNDPQHVVSIPNQQLARQLIPLQRQEKFLLVELGEEHPDVQNLRRKIETIHELNALEAHTQSVDFPGQTNVMSADAAAMTTRMQDIREQIETLRSSEAALDALMERELADARKSYELELELRKSKGEIQRTEKLYSSLMEQLQRVDLGKKLGGYVTSVISPPARGIPIVRSVATTILPWGLLSLLAGWGLAYSTDYLDQRFFSPRQLEERLGVPLIGDIPYIKQFHAGNSNHDDTGISPPLLHYHHDSQGAEAFRELRTDLLFRQDGNGPRVLQVVSPGSGDGTTTMVANLAAAVAHAGKRTLVIDADLRTPCMDSLFRLDPSPGLVSYLTGAGDWRGAVRPTMVENLRVLPCGSLPPNPSELIASHRLHDVLTQAAREYDLVLVDSPALFGLSDARAIAHRVEGILLTLRVGRRNRRHAEQAIRGLGPLAARIIGVTVNNRHGYRHVWKWEPAILRPSPKNVGNQRHPLGAGYVNAPSVNRPFNVGPTISTDHTGRIGELEELCDMQATVGELQSELHQAAEESAKEDVSRHSTDTLPPVPANDVLAGAGTGFLCSGAVCSACFDVWVKWVSWPVA